MLKYSIVFICLGVFIASGLVMSDTDGKSLSRSVLDFTVKDIDGKQVKLSKYKGKVIVIVNVASKCGLTPQYEGLEALYKQHKDKGLVVLGFPSNDFGGQEPGTEKEIKIFCKENYKVTFPMFSKVRVKGENKEPLYSFLTSPESNPKHAGEIEWNFAKFVIDRKGNIADRFAPSVKPTSKDFQDSVTQLLEQK